MSREDDVLRVALAISDRAAVDWEAERAQRPETAALLDELRMIEGVSQTHSGLAKDAGDRHAGIEFAGAWGPLGLIERIGRGAFGEVLRAFDPMLEREVALKLLTRDRSPSSQERFLAEARRLARVRHPNVLTVHGADRHDGEVGMWTDLVSGSTLEEILERRGPFGSGEAIAIGVDLCRALAAVHAAGLVHRDIKAANVMREHGGRIVLMDFGCGVESDAQTSDGVSGTPLTMAPEQLRGEPVGQAADIYGLGVLLYRLLSGHYPIEASSLRELQAAHERGAVVPLSDRRPDLPPALARVVGQAIARDPAQRHASAGTLGEALAAAQQAVSPMRMRSRLVPLAAAAALAIIAALAWLRPWERGGTPATVQSSAPAESRTVSPPVASDAPPAGASTRSTLAATAQLFRDRASGTESLISGSRVAPGDGLFLRFQPSEPVHVYVLNEDQSGALVVLFPAPGLDLVNPLPAQSHRLPGTRNGEPIDWQVTSAGGTETVIVVASRQPLAELERDLAAVPKPAEDAPIVYGRSSEATGYRLRGIAGTVTRRKIAPQTREGRLSDLLRGLPNPAAATSDVWMWQIDLANPAR